MRARLLALWLALLMSLAAAPLPAQRGAVPPAPRLVVILVVDQMRADYVSRFRGDWSGGLKRLLEEGASFSNAAYPYLTTVTCPGHATIATGAFPHTHGIFQNAWYDRTLARQVTCTEDAGVSPVRYDHEGGRTGHSSVRLLAPTLADQLRARGDARVVSLSLKARSAIMLAGRGGTAVTWRNEESDGWETSTMYTPTPVPAVAAFLAANPVSADYDKVWTLMLPEERYLYPDNGEGESAPRGWTTRFPHRLRGEDSGTRPDRGFFARWERSPFANAYLGRFAAALVEAFALGRRDATDVLAISFSSPDLVGHAFGPYSREVQDLYAQLDRTLGTLFGRLDEFVGRDRYVVALSADHGVSRLPEQASRAGHPGGRLNAAHVVDTIERVAQAAVGPGRYVRRISGNDVYFEPGMFDRLKSRPAALGAVRQSLSSAAGIARVFTGDEVEGASTASDPLLRAAALSYVPARSGDLVLALQSGYMFAASGTTHGSPNPDDQRVPLILMGPRVRAGEYGEAATPADIAPTLAELVGATLPRAEGRPLRAALEW